MVLHGFGQKIQIFFVFSFLEKKSNENVFGDFLELTNNFLDSKNKKLKKSPNWDFYEGVTPWFWWKINYFSISFFLGNIGEENVF